MIERILTIILPVLIQQASPEMIKALQSIPDAMKREAKKTSSPADDIIAEILGAFLSELGKK